MSIKTRRASESIGFVVVVAAILVVLNVLAGSFALGRFDLTKADIYSLSEGSKEIARDLEDQMVITAYFSENLPPPYNSTERYVRDLLAEYEAASGGNIIVRFVNPDSEEEREEAEQAGVQLVGQRVYANDSVSVVEGYRGISFEYLGENEALPVITSTTGLEYRITMLMKEMAGETVKVGVVTGFGSATLAEDLSVLQRVLPTYELVEVDLAEAIPEDVESLLLVGPEEPIDEGALQRIDSFVMNGGALAIFGGGVKIDQQGVPTGQPVDSGINRLLEAWGVRMRSDVVGDARCQVIGVRGAMGVMPRPYPPLVIASVTEAGSEHPSAFGLNETRMPFSSSIEVLDAPEGVTIVPVTTSSEQSWSIQGESMQLRQDQRWTLEEPVGPFPLAVAISGSLPSAFADASSQGEGSGSAAAEEARVMVVGSAAAIAVRLPPQQEVSDDEIASALAFPLDVIDWLSADEELIAIRAKNVDEPTLDIPEAVLQAQAEEDSAVQNRDVEGVLAARQRAEEAIEAWEARKQTYRWANMLGIPVVFVAFGLVRWRMRKKKKASLSS